MRISTFDLTAKILVVAEIGNNHEGDVAVAERLVRAAAEAGAGAVKFQTFRTDDFVSRGDPARIERLKRFELAPSQFASLAEFARTLGLLFISTPLDLQSAAALEPLVDAFKIASGDIDFYPLLEAVARTGKPLIVSSGLSDLDRIRRATEFIQRCWTAKSLDQDLAVLHCVTAYPAPLEELNLAAIRTLSDRLGCTVGYSDHTLGLEACILAAAAGARVIEKHFTLNKEYSAFRDHQLSADPEELRRLVREIARVEVLMGSPDKRPQSCEEPLMTAARRSIAAAVDLPAGHRLALEDLTWLRPANGVPPGHENRLVGRQLQRAIARGDFILPTDVTPSS